MSNLRCYLIYLLSVVRIASGIIFTTAVVATLRFLSIELFHFDIDLRFELCQVLRQD